MNDVKCSVITCKYNNRNLCSAGKIDIENKEANSISDTLCKTFIYDDSDERSGNHEPNKQIKINCIVEKCMHNNLTNHLCNAKVVEIVGEKAKCDCETDCKTFITKY